jgi:hypothetical protein
MGRIDIILPDEMETKFREEVFKRYGMKKGNLTDAITEAIQQWMKKKKLVEED